MDNIEKLIEIARQVEKSSADKSVLLPEEHRRSLPIIRFCAEYSLKSGINKIHNDTIFKAYKKWEQEHAKQRLSRVDFFRLFSKMFVSGRDGSGRYYLLSIGLNDEKK